MNNGDAHQAMSCITPELVRQTLLDLIDIRSPTGHEAGMAEYIVQRFRRAGSCGVAAGREDVRTRSRMFAARVMA